MPSATLFQVFNDEGQDLADNFVSPICQRLGVNLIPARIKANRGDALLAQGSSNFVIWDGSVEKGHVYHAFNEWAKNSKRDILLSRTPLPRNVLAPFQCAPIHGKAMTNQELGSWLEMLLATLISETLPPMGIQAYLKGIRAGHGVEAMLPEALHAPDYVGFLSFRGGSSEEAAKVWAMRQGARLGRPIRMVSAGQYAYSTECVTLQQMWEGVACLSREMDAIGRVCILLSEEYFDSFWTCSELLMALDAIGKTNHRLGEVVIANDTNDTLVPAHGAIISGLIPPPPDPKQSYRLFNIISNSDPLSAAPETRYPPQGMQRLVAAIMRRRTGHYHPDFVGDFFWTQVLVPCAVCRCKKRRAADVNWNVHLSFDRFRTDGEGDPFGYFPVTPEELNSGRVICPRCTTNICLTKKRSSRWLWVPILTSERHTHRPVLYENPVWEVIGEQSSSTITPVTDSAYG